jgi:hypothetical protein
LVARAEKAKGSPLSSAEVEAIEDRFASMQRQLEEAKKGQAAPPQEVVVHNTVMLDGEVVAQSQARQKRSNDARAFKPPGKGDDS